MKKIIVVTASPRKGGNCDVMAETLRAAVPNAQVELFPLRDKTVNPCHACNACKGKAAPACVQADDMGALVSRLDACDAFVLIAPIYFGQLNGPAKTFIDRLYCFFDPQKPQGSAATRRGKKAALICSCGGGPVDVYTKYAKDTAACFSVAGADEVRAAVCGNGNTPGNCAKDEAFMRELRTLAAWLNA